MQPDAPTPEALCGLLAEPDRLKVYAAVVLGADVPSLVSDQTGLPARTVTAALRRLQVGGLITIDDGRLRAAVAVFRDSVRQPVPDPAPAEPLDQDRQKAQVLRAFITDGRLAQVPAARSKRLIVLEHIVASFEPGVRYAEREVDAVLQAWHEDHASLRRYLIDEQLMQRDAGVYWRTGGYVEV